MLYFITSIYLMLMMALIYMMFLSQTTILLEYELSSFSSYLLNMSFYIDSMAAKFLVTVLLISGSVMLYSYSYMDDEQNSLRFILIVCLFIISMLILIVGGSVPLLLLGWDGLGLSSYFLIVHYQSYKSSGSGLITVISNRVGDIFIITSSIIIMSQLSSFFFLYTTLSFVNILLLGSMLILGAITKSAQFPYCTWLPEAMAAPTPVSSLVHSSTLVTAGVYLLIRASLWLPLVLMLSVGVVSSFTLLLSSGSAMFCLDFKKTIALSTLSQLAFMLSTLSMSLIHISFFHLITHALFKSSLFMAAGSLIHLGSGNQDMRFKNLTPFNNISMILISIPILALMGAPFTSGFFSKEMILLTAFSFGTSVILTLTMILGAFMTMLYSARMLICLTLFNNKMSSLTDSIFMDYSKIMLMSLSVLAGWLYIYSNSMFNSMSPLIVYFLQGLFIYIILLWTNNLLKFNPKMAISWNQFNYLSRLTNSTTPFNQTIPMNFIITNWESGWQEVLGPKMFVTTTTFLLNKLQNLNQASFNFLIGGTFLFLFIFIILL